MRHPRHSTSALQIATLAVSIFTLQSMAFSQLSSTDRPTDIPFVSSQISSPVKITVLSNPQSVVLRPQISGLTSVASASGERWRIDNEGIVGVDGKPNLPAISRWVVVPDRGDLSLHYSIESSKRIAGDAPELFQGESEDGSRIEATHTTLTGIWPKSSVTMGAAKVWRGVRMVNVVIYPVQWDADNHEYVQSDITEVSISTLPARGVNEVIDHPREYCSDFQNAIRALTVNPPSRDDVDEEVLPGSYLVVANENPPAAVDEFITAKRAAGHQTELLTFDPEATPKERLKALIQERYFETGFSFLVLMGNEEADPPIQIPFDNEFYDSYFGQLDGDDEIADVAVGSYNCQTVDNLTCAIRRTLAYEYDPTQGGEENDWLNQAFVGVGHCSVADQRLDPSSDFSPSYSGMWVTDVLEKNRFEVTSTYYVDRADNDFSPNVAAEYNAGVNLIIVRGHQSDFNPAQIRPGRVFPFHFMVSSSTISPGDGGFGGSFNRTFRMGTPADMRGPSAGFGHYPSPRTNIANAIVGGLTEGLFFLNIKSFGWARNYLTTNILRVMPADQGQDVTRYWGTLRYYGDPGQEPWINPTNRIRGVNFPQSLSAEATGVKVVVNGEQGPIEDATVALYQVGGIQLVESHAVDGVYSFNWEHGTLGDTPIYLTVTGSGMLPVKREISINDDHEFLSLVGVTVDREGNERGLPVRPGDPFFINLSVMNESAVPVDGFDLHMEAASIWATGEGTTIVPGRIDQGERVNGIEVQQQNRQFFILPGCPDGEKIRCNVTFLHDNVAQANGAFDFEVVAPNLELTLNGEGDQDLEPGGSRELSLTVSNTGRTGTGQLTIAVVPVSQLAEIENGAFRINPIAPDQNPVETPDFTLRIDDSALPSQMIQLQVVITGAPGIQDTTLFSLPLRHAEVGEPVGPDKYGYVALDDNDDLNRWDMRPDYRWVNISPWDGEFRGDLLAFPATGEIDSSVVVELPFEFRYYGQGYRQITVCNNGWIAMGDQSKLRNQQNWPLPGFDGAYGMIAPFWDRLEMQTRSDGVFVFFDQADARFIIQWQTGTLNDQNEWLPNAFEVMLLDPQRYQTPTGDSPFIFQYNTANNVQDRWEENSFCTVGISSPDCLDGITYTYWNEYTPGAAILQGGRAILWTTGIAGVPAPVPSVVEGYITRYIDGAPISEAIVSSSSGQSTSSDREGYYRLVEVSIGHIDISVDAIGYDSVRSIGLELGEQQTIQRDFILAHGWVTVDEDTIQLAPWTERADRDTISISNPGNRTSVVKWELVVSDSALWDPRIWLNLFPDSLVLDSGATGEMIVEVTYPFGAEDFQGLIKVKSDSPAPTIELPLYIHVILAADKPPESPFDYCLLPAYPNPFNSTTRIGYQLPMAGIVKLGLFDLSGRQVMLLESGEKAAGSHELSITSDGLTSGIYMLRMEAGSYRATERLLLIK